MSILIPLLTIVEVLICLLLILIIMMQRPRQEGLGASFGSGVMDQIAGVQTTNVLQKGTAWLGGALFATTILLASLVAKNPANRHDTEKKVYAAEAEAAAKAAAAKAPEAKDAPAAPAATNGPALKLTPGGGATTSDVITVGKDGGTSTKLPNGAGTVVVKPGNATPKPAADAAKPAAPAEAKPTAEPAPAATPPAAPAAK